MAATYILVIVMSHIQPSYTAALTVATVEVGSAANCTEMRRMVRLRPYVKDAYCVVRK